MTLIKVLDGPVAKYLPGSGVMLVARSAQSFLDLLTTSAPDPADQEEITAFVHECVHHLQTLSSPFLWRDALLRFEASQRILFPDDSADRAAATGLLARRQRAFHYRAFGVSCADLCEASAVLESYRARAANPTVGEFLRWRDHAFPGKGNSSYRRTFDIMADLCGNEAAFDLLPVVTLLALQSDIPGRAFQLLLAEKSLRDPNLIGAPAHTILEALNFPVPPMLDQDNASHLRPSQRHITLYPVHQHVLAELGDQALDVFARPHTAFAPPFRQSLLPPLVIGAHLQGETVSLTFGAARSDKELRQKLSFCTATLAAATRLLEKESAWIPCPHDECPNHSTGMCAGWLVPPKSPALCGLRGAVREVQGNELYEIAAEFHAAGLSDDLATISASTDLSAIFPEAEPMTHLDEEFSFAAEFDDRHLLDPEDNDVLVLNTCPACHHFWQEWASQKKMQRGFLAVCPSCGKGVEINNDRAFVTQM